MSRAGEAQARPVSPRRALIRVLRGESAAACWPACWPAVPGGAALLPDRRGEQHGAHARAPPTGTRGAVSDTAAMPPPRGGPVRSATHATHATHATPNHPPLLLTWSNGARAPLSPVRHGSRRPGPPRGRGSRRYWPFYRRWHGRSPCWTCCCSCSTRSPTHATHTTGTRYGHGEAEGVGSGAHMRASAGQRTDHACARPAPRIDDTFCAVA